MKHLLILIALAATTAATAQTLYPIERADQPIEIGRSNLGYDTIDGIIVGKYAEFEALIMNRRTKEISTQWKITFKSVGQEKKVPYPAVYVELKTGPQEYNLKATGDPLGSFDEMMALYGAKDTIVNGTDTTYGWKKDVNGEYLTTQTVMDGWSYYMANVFDQSVKLKQVIRQTLLKQRNLAYVQRKINEALAPFK